MSKEAGGKSYGTGVTPWMLCEDMNSSGIAHVDALRCDVIKYAFRLKNPDDPAKLVDDLEKAAHCATRAVEILRKKFRESTEPELPFVEMVIFHAPEVAACKVCNSFRHIAQMTDGVCRDCYFKMEGHYPEGKK